VPQAAVRHLKQTAALSPFADKALMSRIEQIDGWLKGTVDPTQIFTIFVTISGTVVSWRKLGIYRTLFKAFSGRDIASKKDEVIGEGKPSNVDRYKARWQHWRTPSPYSTRS